MNKSVNKRINTYDNRNYYRLDEKKYVRKYPGPLKRLYRKHFQYIELMVCLKNNKKNH